MKNHKMTLAALAILVVGMAGPALAGDAALSVGVPDATSGSVNLGTYHVATGEWSPPGDPGESHFSETIWENSSPSGFFFSVPNTTLERLNVGDLPDGTLLGEITVGFATDSSDPVGFSVTLYPTNGVNSQGPPLQTASGNNAVFNVTTGPLPGTPGIFVSYFVTLDLGPDDWVEITGPDVDGNPGTDWGWGTVFTNSGNASVVCGGGGNPCIGPLLSTAGPVGASGSEDFWDQFDPAAWQGGTYQGTFFFGGFPPATFYGAFGSPVLHGVEVPSVSRSGLVVLALLLGGLALLVLRRRV